MFSVQMQAGARSANPRFFRGDGATSPDEQTLLKEETEKGTPWQVVVHNDPVNIMDYVTWVFMRVLGFGKAKAETHMMEVHNDGRSVVWTGNREKAELYTQQLQAHQLTTSLEKAEG